MDHTPADSPHDPPAGAPPAPAVTVPALVPPAPHHHDRLGFRGVLLFLAVFMTVTATLVFAVPVLLARWRLLDGEAQAEVLYQKRRAELRAEADEAERFLDVLDKRVNLTALNFRAVVQKVTPAVVNVTSFYEIRGSDPGPGHGLGGLYEDPQTGKLYRFLGVGSGVLVKPGQVLTNYHVVREWPGLSPEKKRTGPADRFRVTFASGQSIAFDAAGHVFLDQSTDLALLRLPPEPPARFRPDYDFLVEVGDSDRDVDCGDFVLAVGSPLGLKQTVTHGIISAKGRRVEKITSAELLQTDAAINPGNSGGALFTQHGKLIGINVAIASDSGVNQGIAFAIPSNAALKVFHELAAKGKVSRGFLGVRLSELEPAQVKALGLKKNAGGVEVVDVIKGQAAQKAGMLAGDVILGYENDLLEPDDPVRQLTQWIMEQAPQQPVTLELLRGGRRLRVVVQVGTRPAD